jgi:N-acyl-D-aspartate/D-glutamate deacylase
MIQAVVEFLRSSATQGAKPHIAYQARVAANALELVGREMDLAPREHSLEAERLRTLLGRDGSLPELNAAFAEALEQGALSMSSPAVLDHLWQTTLAKVAVDQPSYSGYQMALAMRRGLPNP